MNMENMMKQTTENLGHPELPPDTKIRVILGHVVIRLQVKQISQVFGHPSQELAVQESTWALASMNQGHGGVVGLSGFWQGQAIQIDMEK